MAKAKLGGEFFQTITSNAHSLYLQMAERTGIPCVLCLLVFAGIYLVQSWKLYRRKALTFEERSGRAIFLAVSGYLIAGLCWASSVCTTPFFWMLLGMGAAINKNMKIFQKIFTRKRDIIYARIHFYRMDEKEGGSNEKK